MSAVSTPTLARRRVDPGAPSGRTIAGLFAAALLLGLVVEHVADSWTQPAYIPIIDLGLGLLMVGCGLAAAVARPGQPAGRRLVLAGFLWYVGTFMGGADGSPARMVGFAFGGYHDLVLAWLALSFPDRWPAWPVSRAVLAVAAVLYGLGSVARVVFAAPATFGVDLLAAKTAEQVVLWLDVLHLAAIVVAGFVMLARLARARGSERRQLAPVLLAGAAASFAAAFGARYALWILGFVPDTPQEILIPVTWAIHAVRVAVPLAILYGVVKLRGARAAMAGAVATVGDAPTTSALRGALAAALGDRDLRILTRHEGARWRDTDGTTIDEETLAALDSEPGVHVEHVDAAGEELAVLVLARSVAEDPALLDAGVSLTRLVVRNEQQAARIQEQLADVRASRARIVEAADTERRRIERDLHDGLQQRMVALAMQLRSAEGAEDRDAALRAGSAEILAILEDVRELARGIHPAVLTEAGLGAAIRAAADRSPVPAEVDLRLGGAGTPAAQATAYYVVSEALANVAKHAAGASGVWIRADDDGGRIRVVVEDDGPGGADAAGHGLAGLADRVAALDGRFGVGPGSTGGTRVVAEVPVG